MEERMLQQPLQIPSNPNYPNLWNGHECLRVATSLQALLQNSALISRYATLGAFAQRINQVDIPGHEKKYDQVVQLVTKPTDETQEAPESYIARQAAGKTEESLAYALMIKDLQDIKFIYNALKLEHYIRYQYPLSLKKAVGFVETNYTTAPYIDEVASLSAMDTFPITCRISRRMKPYFLDFIRLYKNLPPLDKEDSELKKLFDTTGRGGLMIDEIDARHDLAPVDLPETKSIVSYMIARTMGLNPEESQQRAEEIQTWVQKNRANEKKSANRGLKIHVSADIKDKDFFELLKKIASLNPTHMWKVASLGMHKGSNVRSITIYPDLDDECNDPSSQSGNFVNAVRTARMIDLYFNQAHQTSKAAISSACDIPAGKSNRVFIRYGTHRPDTITFADKWFDDKSRPAIDNFPSPESYNKFCQTSKRFGLSFSSLL